MQRLWPEMRCSSLIAGRSWTGRLGNAPLRARDRNRRMLDNDFPILRNRLLRMVDECRFTEYLPDMRNSYREWSMPIDCRLDSRTDNRSGFPGPDAIRLVKGTDHGVLSAPFDEPHRRIDLRPHAPRLELAFRQVPAGLGGS